MAGQACRAVRIAAAIAARTATAVLQPARGEGVLTHTAAASVHGTSIAVNAVTADAALSTVLAAV